MDKHEFTAQSFQAAFPEIHEEIRRAGFDAGVSEGLKTGREEGMAAGAEVERERIRGIESISVPGHEALISGLKFDGKTTGPEAAVKVLEAEQALRKTKQESFVADSVKPAAQAGDPPDTKATDAADENLPVEERCKARWDRSPELRDEFKMGGFKAYLAFEKNKQNVRIFEKKPE